MFNLIKDSECSNICHEWALDFKQKNLISDFLFFNKISDLFKTGGIISDNDYSVLLVEINNRIIVADRFVPDNSELYNAILSIASEAKKLKSFIDPD